MASVMSQSCKLLGGYEMPVLGLGTWQLVGSTCERIVRAALGLGYRHFDTVELDGWELSAQNVQEIEEMAVEARIIDSAYT